MTRRVHRCADLADARRVYRVVNWMLGFPRAGIDVGRGRHAPPQLTVTRRWRWPLARRVLGQWRFAYPLDEIVEALHGRTVSIDGTDHTLTLSPEETADFDGAADLDTVDA